jgi:hypothetical protein
MSLIESRTVRKLRKGHYKTADKKFWHLPKLKTLRVIGKINTPTLTSKQQTFRLRQTGLGLSKTKVNAI